MKVLFIGLGSIGSRHLRNLSALCARRHLPLQVTALRAIARPLPAGLSALVHRQLAALPPGEGFDLAFVCNPTSLHAGALAQIKGRAGCLFIEKPLFESASHSLEALGLGENQRAYVAAPMRFTALYAALKKQLPAIQPRSVRVICSSYLPGWRPGVSYQQVYSARAEMGGGVTLDLIHEWDYLCDLFGPPLQLANLRGQYSGLQVSADDLSVYIARWAGMLGEVHLDYFGREYRRQIELMCDEGSWTADFGTGRLCPPGADARDCAEDANARYLREMEYFLRYAAGQEGEESLNSPRRALQVLKIALGEME